MKHPTVQEAMVESDCPVCDAGAGEWCFRMGSMTIHSQRMVKASRLRFLEALGEALDAGEAYVFMLREATR